jgi:integrase
MADFMVAGNRYREFGFATETDAGAWELLARAALMKGQPLPPGPSSSPANAAKAMTIDDLVRHVEQVHWSSRKSRVSLTRNAAMFAEYCGPKLPAAECMTYAVVSEYVTHLQGKSVGGSTINRYLSAISKLSDYAVALGLIPGRILLPWQKEGEGRVRWFTEAEEAAILATTGAWGYAAMRDLFIFLVDTGARRGEALDLPWDAIRDGRRAAFFDTKNGSTRTVVLTPRAQAAVARRKAEDPTSRGPFTTVNASNIQAVWLRLRTHHPWIGDAVVHTFRHTCASRLAQGGVDLFHIKEWMGHSSIQSTQRYSHLCPKNMEDIAGILERRSAK